MKDSESLIEFTRVKRHENRIAIQVAWITWPHPHESKLNWHTLKNLDTGEDTALINITRKSIIFNDKYSVFVLNVMFGIRTVGCGKAKFANHVLKKIMKLCFSFQPVLFMSLFQ